MLITSSKLPIEERKTTFSTLDAHYTSEMRKQRKEEKLTRNLNIKITQEQVKLHNETFSWANCRIRVSQRQISPPFYILPVELLSLSQSTYPLVTLFTLTSISLESVSLNSVFIS